MRVQRAEEELALDSHMMRSMSAILVANVRGE